MKRLLIDVTILLPKLSETWLRLDEFFVIRVRDVQIVTASDTKSDLFSTIGNDTGVRFRCKQTSRILLSKIEHRAISSRSIAAARLIG